MEITLSVNTSMELKFNTITRKKEEEFYYKTSISNKYV